MSLKNKSFDVCITCSSVQCKNPSRYLALHLAYRPCECTGLKVAGAFDVLPNICVKSYKMGEKGKFLLLYEEICSTQVGIYSHQSLQSCELAPFLSLACCSACIDVYL